MVNFAKLLTRTCLYACLFFVAISCKDTDDFFSNNESKPVSRIGNTFDFSTTQKVDLIVDYSAFETYGPVLFSIYNRDPFVADNVSNPYYLDESIDPIFSDYTDANGKYDATITIPAYAKVLYIVTGDLYVHDKRLLAEVVNGKAKAVAVNYRSQNGARSITRTTDAGVSTRDLSRLYNLSFICSSSQTGYFWANSGERIYKDWLTPLGTWNSASGRPDYLLPHTAENIAKGLVFNDEEMQGLFAASKAALKSTSTCSEQYRAQSDMTLIKDSEVSITILGGNTCWCSTLGYYYYTDETKPQSTLDMNIIMLFPNTMNDYYADCPNTNFNGNSGTRDGDVVQLMYYPPMANGELDLTKGTTTFPKGTKIGFIMKTNGWAMQGTGYYITAGSGSGKAPTWDCYRRYNVWPTSTDGLSYCRTNEKAGSGNWKYDNPNGDSRTAKFGYVAPNGTEYAIVGFEDACNDLNYSDVIFALNPAEAFTALPEVGDNKTTTVGVYAFEDLWPSRGDYDMNDVVVNVRNELNFNSSGKVTKQVFYLTTYEKNVELQNGLAVRLKTSATPSKITMKKTAPGSSEAKSATFASYKDNNTGYTVYYLVDDILTEETATYIFELTYSGIDQSKAADVEPFIYREESNGKQWEVHIPMVQPTSKMNTAYFNTGDDCSDTSKGEYYVRQGNYPFAFYLSGTKASAFFDTILGADAENQTIDAFYPTFLPWSVSKGTTNEDWYLKSR